MELSVLINKSVAPIVKAEGELPITDKATCWDKTNMSGLKFSFVYLK